MNCPICNRANSVALSICPSCGAMINDSVRQELKPKTSPVAKSLNFEKKENSPMSNKLNQQVAVANSPSQTEPKQHTSELTVKQTSSTLIDFHSKNAALPEWRLKLQNAVRQRQQQGGAETEISDLPPARQTKLVTGGANAIKAEIVEETAPTTHHKNPTLNSALQRIEKSRQQFLTEEKPEIVPVVPAPTARKNYPFHIAAKQTEVAPKPITVIASVNPPIKPKLAPSLKTDSEPLDTNKLPPLPEAVKSSPGFAQRLVNSFVGETKVEEKKEEIELVKTEEIVETEIEEIDDCAPFAMRFNAGLFDVIIGSFSSLLLLSPFAFWGGSWFTFTGLLAFLATCAVVMFIYMTISIGFYGTTVGMRLFSLEVVDIEGEDYPTMHQAAVSSAVYLLSLACGGIGFLTLPFNEEKRAVHDLISKTIVIREF